MYGNSSEYSSSPNQASCPNPQQVRVNFDSGIVDEATDERRRLHLLLQQCPNVVREPSQVYEFPVETGFDSESRSLVEQALRSAHFHEILGLQTQLKGMNKKILY